MNNILSEQDKRAVLEILTLQLSVQPAQLTLDAKIQEDLGADSLDVIEIVMAVEERFGVCVGDAEAEKVSTVGDLIDTLARVQSMVGQVAGGE
jgi:acyl carrier protein